MQLPQRIHLLDTSVASDNVGDEIIVQSLRALLFRHFPDAHFSSSSTHDGLGAFGRRLAAQADLVFFLGTNALSARYRRLNIWPISAADVRALEGKVVLFGVGANERSRALDWRQKRMLRRLLAAGSTHCLRDDSAFRIVDGCGLPAMNGSCPTLWALPATQCFPAARPDTVCLALTHYRPAPDADSAFVRLLASRYRRLVLWPQQFEDIAYLRNLSVGCDVEMIAPNLPAYDRFLAETDGDIIGSRLHGGIRALAAGKRTVILSVDNRAEEIGRETGLPVLPRDRAAEMLPEMLDNEIKVDMAGIRGNESKFFRQFTVPELPGALIDSQRSSECH